MQWLMRCLLSVQSESELRFGSTGLRDHSLRLCLRDLDLFVSGGSMNSKQVQMWTKIRQWCIEHPGKKALICTPNGNFHISYQPLEKRPLGITFTTVEQK